MPSSVLFLSFVAASISFTVAETKLFKPSREWLQVRNVFLGGLISCGYCLGHWVAVGLVAVYRPKQFTAWWLLDYFLAAPVIAWFSAFQWAAMCWLMGKAHK